MPQFWSYIGNDQFNIGCTGQTVYVYDKAGKELARFKDLIYAYLPVLSPRGDSFVVKTTEGYGIVKKVEFGLTDRPMVVMYADLEGNILPKPYEECLHLRPEHKIDSVVDDSMLLIKIRESGFDPASLL